MSEEVNEFAKRVSKVLEEYIDLPETAYFCNDCPLSFIKKVRRAESCAALVKQIDPELTTRRYLPCSEIVSTVEEYYYDIYYKSLFGKAPK